MGESPRNIRTLIKDLLVPAIVGSTVKSIVVSDMQEEATILRVCQMAREMLLLKKPTDQNFRYALKGWLDSVSKIGSEEIIATAKETLELIKVTRNKGLR